MKIIFGILLLIIFILTICVMAFTYVYAVNQNINKMLKKKGYKNYKIYKKYMETKYMHTDSDKLMQIKNKINKSIDKINYKKYKKEEKKQVEDYLKYEMSQRRRKI